MTTFSMPQDDMDNKKSGNNNVQNSIKNKEAYFEKDGTVGNGNTGTIFLVFMLMATKALTKSTSENDTPPEYFQY
jgi:hypothetical protein